MFVAVPKKGVLLLFVRNELITNTWWGCRI